MTERIKSPLTEPEAQVVGNALQAALIDLVDLGLLGKQLHWNVIGPRFRSVHLQLDDLVNVARSHSDTIAERAVAIGCPPNAQSRDVAAATKIAPVEPGLLQDDKVVALVVERLRDLVARMRERMRAVEDADPTTQDLLNDALHDLEEQYWMWQAAQG